MALAQGRGPAAAILAVTLNLTSPDPATSQDRGCVAAAETVAALVLTGDGDLASADGRLWTLAGVGAVPGDADAAVQLAARQAAIRAYLEAGPFAIAPTVGRPDRWNRTPALVWRPGQAESLAAHLVGAGLATAQLSDVPTRCGRILAEAEAQARRAGRASWAQDGARLDAADPAGILRNVGRYAVVEGVVISATERKTRAYLNFGANWSEDFTVTISKRSLNRMEASGMRWSSLRGQRVRVRGVVTESGGPMIEISLPEDIERIE